ncbi:MAG: transcriptional repressor [Clostridiales bacterium]|nr:transcriptional repressor [Clostridiales bacterium]
MAGKRYSRQRELIYQAVCDSDQHPTAEMVYQWLKPANPSLSLGTVYRNLNLLADEGILVRMPFPVERYDADTRPHTHFRCRQCGCVFDFKISYDREIDAAAGTAEPEFRIEDHTLLFSGLCPRCLEKKQVDFS